MRQILTPFLIEQNFYRIMALNKELILTFYTETDICNILFTEASEYLKL